MKMKRTLILCLTLIICAALTIGSTLAYLTDTDSQVNVFTMGNVDISLQEAFDAETAKLYPGVTIEKKVWIKNEGKTNAYVWYTFAVPAAMDNALALEYAFNKGEGGDKWITADYAPVVKNYVDPLTGEMCNVYTVLYNDILLPENVTPYSLESVTLSEHVDYHNKQFGVVKNGAFEPIDWTPVDNKLNVTVNAYAIQQDGFETLKDAYLAYQGQWGAISGVEIVNVSTAQDLVDAINNATQDTYINLTGKVAVPQIKITHAMPAFTISGGEFDGQFFVTGNLTLKNMTVTNENATTAGISKAADNAIYVQGEGVVKCENVTFDIKKATGITTWWSSASTNSSAKWNNVILKNCVFNANGNRPLQIEGNATIEGCTFNDPYRYAAQLTCGNVNSEQVVINFRDNTITQSLTSKNPTYGLQLTNDYGNENMQINGSGNKIVDKGADDVLYVFELNSGLDNGTVEIDTITFNVTDGVVYQLDGENMTQYTK